MPSYDFENKETGEIEEHMMSYTKLDQFKKDNPHLKQVILSAPLAKSNLTSLNFLMPPPTVRGINTDLATFLTISTKLFLL